MHTLCVKGDTHGGKQYTKEIGTGWQATGDGGLGKEPLCSSDYDVNTANPFLFNSLEVLCIDLISPCKGVYPAHWNKEVHL